MARRFVVFASLLFLTACASGATSSAPLAETSANLSMHDFMKTVIDPAANTVFAAGNAEDPSKISAAQWKATIHAAGVLQESGRLLLIAPRVRTEKEWMDAAQLLVDAGADASAAAGAKSGDGAFEAGGKLYESCNGCHAKYIHGKT